MIALTSMGPILVGCLAASVAVWGIRTQRTIALKRATLDVILRSESDKDIIDAHACFNRLARSNGGLATFAEEDHQGSRETESIRIILNQYEIIAIGIKQGILDEDLYYEWFGTGLLRHWRYAQPFILRIRQRVDSDKPFAAFEELVSRFSRRI